MGNGKWVIETSDNGAGGHTTFRVAGPWPLWLPLTRPSLACSRRAGLQRVPLIRAKVTSNCCRRAKVPLGAQLDASPVKPESLRALPTPALRCRAARRCGVQGADSRCLSSLVAALEFLEGCSETMYRSSASNFSCTSAPHQQSPLLRNALTAESPRRCLGLALRSRLRGSLRAGTGTGTLSFIQSLSADLNVTVPVP